MLKHMPIRYFSCRVLPLAAFWLMIGCGPSGPKTHPVIGRVELKNGDVTQLVGSTVEVALTSDPTTRGFGAIEDNGAFELRTIREGEIRQGILEGRYTVRIIPNDEDEATRKRVKQAIAPRYLKFETSGLSVQAPAAGEIVLNITTR